jgi:pyruvate kinase
MTIQRGVTPILVDRLESAEELISAAERGILKRKIARSGDLAVLVGGSNLSARGNVNSLKIRRIGSQAERPE